MAEEVTRERRAEAPPPSGPPPGAPHTRNRGVTAGALAAEVVGTFILVFVGTGTVLATAQLAPDAPPNDTAISLAFGFAVLVAVYTFGHVSGAHINPSVTIGLAAVRRFPWSWVPGYLAAQLAGALLAALSNWVLFGEDARERLALGATMPGERGAAVAFFAEFVITFLLLVTVMATAVDERSPGPLVAGIAIGLVIGAMIFVSLPVSGGSLNAARTFGPMIVAWQFTGWWVYLVGPAAGGIAGAATWEFLLSRGRPPS